MVVWIFIFLAVFHRLYVSHHLAEYQTRALFHFVRVKAVHLDVWLPRLSPPVPGSRWGRCSPISLYLPFLRANREFLDGSLERMDGLCDMKPHFLPTLSIKVEILYLSQSWLKEVHSNWRFNCVHIGYPKLLKHDSSSRGLLVLGNIKVAAMIPEARVSFFDQLG